MTTTTRRALIAGGAVSGVLAMIVGETAAEAPALPMAGMFCPECEPERIERFVRINHESMGLSRFSYDVMRGDALMLYVMEVGRGWFVQPVGGTFERAPRCAHCEWPLYEVVHEQLQLRHADGHMITF